MRTVWPSGSAAREQLVSDRAPTTTTCAPATSSSGQGAAAVDAHVANVEQRRLRAVDRRVLEVAPARADVAPVAGRWPRKGARSPAARGSARRAREVGIARDPVCQFAAAESAGRDPGDHERIAAKGSRAGLAGRRARPMSPVCTTAVVATAAAMARPASDARSGLRADRREASEVLRRRGGGGTSCAARGGDAHERAVLQFAQRLVGANDDRARLRRRRRPRYRGRR